MFPYIKKYVSKITGTITTVIQYSCVAYCFTEYIAEISICSGPSMEPTLSSNNIIISERISVKRFRFNYNDIVISKSPVNPKDYICKRIIGLPGDKIKLNHFESKWVPVGHVWLEGDNKNNSTDSRNYGPVPQGLIRGKVICKIWPLKDISIFNAKYR